MVTARGPANESALRIVSIRRKAICKQAERMTVPASDAFEGTNDEDIGDETEETGVVDLPTDMIERLRVDLSVWRPPEA